MTDADFTNFLVDDLGNLTMIEIESDRDSGMNFPISKSLQNCHHDAAKKPRRPKKEAIGPF
jgi:hypothetical protein